MGVEENKAVAQRWYSEVWNQTNLDQVMKAIEELHAPDLLDHNPLQGQPPGMEGLKFMVGGLRQGYPDMRFEVDPLVAQGDKVVGRWTMTATNTGPLTFMGLPATGKAIQITGIDIMRIVDGKIVELWHQEDVMSMMMQLGFIPAPARA
jgi:steroid delta-isomerase-like uncharacterized protein